jgi:cytochrome c oxidase cbb3-type subunit 2
MASLRLVIIVLVSITWLSLARATPPEPDAARRGAHAYGRYCVSCHGVRGDGRGRAAAWMDPRPRVFTGGTFKFRSTPAGELPTDDDIYRSITTGLFHSNMPRWAALTELERRDLVQYLKSLSPRFTTEEQVAPLVVPPAPPMTPALVEQGQGVWQKLGCASCHGDTGRGDGASAATLKDDWGFPILPRDLSTGQLKSGSRPEDIYRTVMTGLNGTPMPSFAESITPDEAWALVAFVGTLRAEP